MSTKVWGTLPTVHQPISLSYVMSEELAHKLQDKPVHEDMDKDLLLALELSKVEAENGNTSHHTSISSTDEDYLVALQLQQEEEQSASYRVARPTGMAKLSVVYGEVRDEISDDIIPRLSEDEDSEDEVDEQEGLLDSLLENIDFVTKHNPILSGIRNADTLERSPVETGNLNTPISNPVFSGLHESVKHQQVNQNKARGNKIKHSTNENVLDTHTRELLLKMLNAGIISELNGVVSTGKEANVYHAIGGEKLPDLLGKELAIKIYKTTLNEFRNRSEYLQHPIGNTRKLVKMWAEKEFQNLRRLKAKGLPVPDAVLQRENILLMTFIGNEGVPAPCFKDAVLSTKSLSSTYVQIVNTMRDMYQRCKLVHADLSEYNILYHAKQATVIDVSQSVEISHGKATEFLRRDVANITNFFNKRGLDNIMTPIELFTFTTASELEPNSVFYKFLISKETETQSSEEPAVDTQ